MHLHLATNNFEGAFIAAADYLKIPEIFIEKDYWVAYALHALFHSSLHFYFLINRIAQGLPIDRKATFEK